VGKVKKKNLTKKRGKSPEKGGGLPITKKAAARKRTSFTVGKRSRSQPEEKTRGKTSDQRGCWGGPRDKVVNGGEEKVHRKNPLKREKTQ